MNQFKETLNLYKQVISCYPYDLNSYEGWFCLPDNLKAVGLYVHFYEQITLAWSKTQKPFIESETAVSTLMQYLMKNVPILKYYPKRYTPAYIYKVAFNTFYPMGRIQRDLDRYNLVVSLFECIGDLNSDIDMDNFYYQDSNYSHRAFHIEFTDIEILHRNSVLWAHLMALSERERIVLDKILNNSRLSKRDIMIKDDVICKVRRIIKKFYL